MTSETEPTKTDPSWVPRDIDFGTEESWSKVEDCYGPSTSTPRTLKKLFSPDESVQNDAVYWLYAALFHQGGRFEATIVAAPLVIEIALHPALPARSRRFLCEYVTALAYGYAEELPYEGVDPAERLAALVAATQKPIRAPVDRKGRRLERYCDTWTARDLYRVILENRARLYPLIEDEDPGVAAAARTALTLLAADDPAFRARMARLLAAASDDLAAGIEPEDPEPAVATLIGVATMARAMRAAKPAELIAPWLDAASPRLRFAAAIALAEPDTIDAYRAPLIEGLTAPSVRGGRRPLEQVWCSLEALAMEIVHEGLSGTGGERDIELWIEGFAANLDAPDVDRALSSAHLILKLLSPCPQKRFKDVAASALTPLQRRGLEAIRDRGLWSLLDDGEFLNFTAMIEAFGLPRKRDAFARYLEE